MDPLSEILGLLKLESYVSGAFDAGGRWSIAIPADPGMKFYAAIHGTCTVIVDGVPDPVHIASGDCVLLPHGRAFSVTNDTSLTPVDVFTIGSSVKVGGVTTYNGGGDFLCLIGNFTLSRDYAAMLIGMLPPIVHISRESDRALLRWCIERMRDELRTPQPGGSLIAQQLATTMLVHVLRLHLADGVRGGVGWLFALADPQMAAAITAMHEDPAGRWTLQTLAERAGMSRTTFTLRFRDTVGASPIEYLTNWRMMLARERLARSSDPISEIAPALGYESESAFSTAFKRVVGCSPRQYKLAC